MKSYRPVVVQMAELVGESLHVIGLHSAGIVDNIVVSGSDCALPHGLADQEKVVPVTEGTNCSLLRQLENVSSFYT